MTTTLENHLLKHGSYDIQVELESDGGVWIKIEGSYFRPNDWQEVTDFVRRTLDVIIKAGEQL